MTPTLWAAFTGTAGLIVALLVFFRDTPRVVVGMSWNMDPLDGRSGGPFLVIAIANVGRRAIYLSHAHIKWPTRGQGAWLSMDSIEGVTLAEGAPPHRLLHQQSSIEARVGREWWRIRATVVDVAGRAYRSRWPTIRPPFATQDPPPGALLVAHLLNGLDTIRLRLLA